jgi:hypothetical protein
MRPILLNSCARATSAAEARYRIDVPITGRRGARVIALDDGAATLVRRLAGESWHAARFFTLVAGSPPIGGDGMALHRVTAGPTNLGTELAEADVVVMVATDHGSAEAADTIGRACARRGVMTAGLVLGDQSLSRDTLLALRPHAQVLLISHDEQDVAEVLTALRA